MRHLCCWTLLCMAPGLCGADARNAGTPPGKVPEDPAARNAGPGVEWVRAGVDSEQLVWGIRGGLQWGLPPATGTAPDGPRGLIRLRYPVLPGGKYDLINFIAVEPVVKGRKGFSELERSQLDDRPGKRFWVDAPDGDGTHTLGGRLTQLAGGVEQLTLGVKVEPFENGARVSLTVVQRSDMPDEIQLTIHLETESAPIETCILTATMGNKARARRLWLRDRVASSLDLYPDYRDSGFTPHQVFGLDRLHRTPSGDVLVAMTTDEADPSSVEPFPWRVHWYYGGRPVTQYWRKPAGSWRPDLHAAVNGRYTYWMSKRPIPGGVSFENFELRERLHDNQVFIFGITSKTPGELGFPESGSSEGEPAGRTPGRPAGGGEGGEVPGKTVE